MLSDPLKCIISAHTDVLACLAVDSCVESAQAQKPISAPLMNDLSLCLVGVRCISLGRISQVQDLVVGHAKTTKTKNDRGKEGFNYPRTRFFYCCRHGWHAKLRNMKMRALLLCTL